MSLFHNEVHTLATTAGKIIIYTLATTTNHPTSQAGASSGNGKAPVPHEGKHAVDDAVLSQLEQLVDLLEQYFHPSNNGRLVLTLMHVNNSAACEQTLLYVNKQMHLTPLCKVLSSASWSS